MRQNIFPKAEKYLKNKNQRFKTYIENIFVLLSALF